MHRGPDAQPPAKIHIIFGGSAKKKNNETIEGRKKNTNYRCSVVREHRGYVLFYIIHNGYLYIIRYYYNTSYTSVSY